MHDESVDRAFVALSHPARRRLLQLCASGERSATDLGTLLRLGQPATSQHLRILRDVGLISVRPDGNRRFYRLDGPRLEQLRATLNGLASARGHESDGRHAFKPDVDEGRLSSSPGDEVVPRILYAGYRRFETQLIGPDPPGGWYLVFTIAGRAYSDTRGQRATAHRGQLVLLSPAISPRWDVVPGRVWEILFLKLEPMPWVPPPAFDPVSRGLYEARVTSARRLQRMHDAFGRIRADSRDQATAQVLRLSDSGRRTIGAEDSPHREGRGGQSDGLREGNWDPIEPQLMASTLNEILLLTAKDPLDGVTLDARVAAALERLGSYLAADHTLDSLAREASLSASRFAHLFREQVGIPPMRMLLHLRLQEAALRLLHSDDAISLIAEEIGFTSSFDFSRQFRRQYGVSPRAYRSMSRSTGSDS